MKDLDLTTIEPSTHIVTIVIILFVAFLFAVVFVGMVVFANVADDMDSESSDYHPEDEDNVIIR